MKNISGKIIISTRPSDDEDRVSSFLEAEGAEVISVPMIEIEEIPFTKVDLSACDLIIFTSKNGVRSFFNQQQEAIPAKPKFVAVGDRTAEEIKKYTTNELIVNAGNTADDLLQGLKENRHQNILLILGERASDLLEEGLKYQNRLTRLNVYKTREVKSIPQNKLDILRANCYDLIIFASPSAIECFMNLVLTDGIKPDFRLACIGKTTARRAIDYNLAPVVVASSADAIVFAKEITDYLLMN